ncbi:hypothetical protein LJ655_21085 [Paraburkholderia sp. MMS20-SJTN17]|uniref:Proteophosphoglycan ppg4 n=1 Tax=Paraburkholderia translucens TaxID=2886945 RepID=A0ABS8KHX0_9BURK|nr:hypothetical protein [Paraburkholderia sp. MMS20-SJTN17]MCC8404345.1 hypothetical protein [Paraburkholderia sp. MMS20-SJTN17]
MKSATSTLIAAVAALMLSGGAHAQSNNTLATPSVTSPAQPTSGYGTPGATNTDSGKGAWSPDSGQPNSMNSTPKKNAPAYGVNNTLATPGVASPAGGQ